MSYKYYRKTKLLRILNVYIKLTNVILSILFIVTLFQVVPLISGMSHFWSNAFIIWLSIVVTAMMLFILSGSILEFIADEEYKKVELDEKSIEGDLNDGHFSDTDIYPS